MNPQSAKTLAWAAGILLVLGFLIPAPAGSIFMFALAALCALFPVIFARKGPQLAAGALLVVALAAAGLMYPKYQEHMKGFAERAKSGKR